MRAIFSSAAASLKVGCLTTVLLLTVSTAAQAQGQNAAPGAPVVRQQANINWMDAGILAVLAGGAIFAVCRASNRM